MSFTLRRTTHVDLQKGLEVFVTTGYGSSLSQRVKPSLQELQQTRTKIVEVSGHTEEGKDCLLLYYRYLLLAQPRFNLQDKCFTSSSSSSSSSSLLLSAFSSSTTNANVAPPIVFTWTDKTGKKTAVSSWAIEVASVLHNLGCIFFVLALHLQRVGDDVQTAGKKFQTAAHFFDLCRSAVATNGQQLQPVTVDLSDSYLVLLSSLSLASAQECVYIKANKDNMKPLMLAKIAAGLVSQYETVNAYVRNPAISAYIDRAWPDYALLKVLYYKAVSQHHQASHVDIGLYGEAVARLKLATLHLEEAAMILKKNPAAANVLVTYGATGDLVNTVPKLLAIISKQHQQAASDNNVVYTEVVPAANQLSAIEAKVIAKPLPAPELSTEMKDPFEALLPINITRAIQEYQRRVSASLKQLQKQIEDDNKTTAELLVKLNLPGCIDALTSPDQRKLPEPLRVDITNLKAEGGQQQLNELMRTRDELKASTIAQIEKIRTALREEEADDNTMKKQYGSSWTRLTSSELNQAMISELGKYSDFLQQAVSADAVVTENVEAHRQVLQVLQFRQISELEAMLPSVIVDQNSGTNNNNFGISSTLSSQVAQLRTHLQGLEKNKNEKTYLNDEIEKMAATDESPASLTSISAPSEEDIKAAVAKTMQKVESRVGEIIAVSQVLQKCCNDDTRILNDLLQGNIFSQRIKMLESWQMAVKNFSTQKGHLGEGIEFYLSLQEKTSLLEKNAGDFIMARSDEKLELLKSLQRTFAAARPAPAAAPAATGVSSQQQAPGPGGLPSYIEERFDPASNMPYYVNHRDKTTSWERPK